MIRFFCTVLLALSACKSTGDPTPDDQPATEPVVQAESQMESESQTKAEGLKIICEVPTEPRFQEMTPEDRAAEMAKAIDAQLTNPEVKALFATMGEVSADERVQMFQTALDAEGIKTCSLKEMWASVPE